jgi:hypothetical protein
LDSPISSRRTKPRRFHCDRCSSHGFPSARGCWAAEPRQDLAETRHRETAAAGARRSGSGLVRPRRPRPISVRRASLVQRVAPAPEAPRSSSKSVVLRQARRTDPAPESRRRTEGRLSWACGGLLVNAWHFERSPIHRADFELRGEAACSESATRRTEIRSQRGMSVSSSRRAAGSDPVEDLRDQARLRLPLHDPAARRPPVPCPPRPDAWARCVLERRSERAT